MDGKFVKSHPKSSKKFQVENRHIRFYQLATRRLLVFVEIKSKICFPPGMRLWPALGA